MSTTMVAFFIALRRPICYTLRQMKISARTRYGLRILLDIAQHMQNESPRTIGAIASSQDISAAFISRLAVPLKRARIINAERGVGGGLRLARPPEDITLLDISRTLNGPVSVLKCISAPKTCKRHAKCPARYIWTDLNATIENALAAVTLADVMNRTRLGNASGDCRL